MDDGGETDDDDDKAILVPSTSTYLGYLQMMRRDPAGAQLLSAGW